MNIQTTDLILILTLLAVAFFVLYLLIKLINTRPDIIAVLSTSGIVCGLVVILLGYRLESGLIVVGVSCVGLLLAMVTHGRQHP